MVKSTVEVGYSSRSARFKYVTLNYHVRIYDSDKEEDVNKLYFTLTEAFGKDLRGELGITKKGLKDETSKGSDKG